MYLLHSQHYPRQSATLPASTTGSGPLDHPVQPCDFDNAVFVPADEPEEKDGITVSRTDLNLCAPEPLRLVVLMHWRSREQDGQPRSAEAVWAAISEVGMHGDDGEPVRLDDVRRAAAFLLREGLVTAAAGDEL
ncbi:hypothetical protein QQY24_31970 [Streptomyces sp. TG1A-8]|uniref:hypothetical protein n=1 Tax=Streptomyces sp. TG1A-8 TaxID=3051385 RepID=UPI00265BD11C|nr:hypothetical protein [Streptomyces sp. TG1A-8]MDO0929743.1 hypothetical protein [Streptomyces sp. TG1A-8]